MLLILWDFICAMGAGALAIWIYKKMNPTTTHCPHCGEALIDTSTHWTSQQRQEPTATDRINHSIQDRKIKVLEKQLFDMARKLEKVDN